MRFERKWNYFRVLDLSVIQSLVYVLILLMCFMLFQQGDLVHTTLSSYAYLDGHFSGFYDFNKAAVGGNDYLPIIYIIFAAWNIPLYIFGLVTPANLFPAVTIVEIAWAKLLLVAFFIATIFVIKRIECVIENCNLDSKYPPSLLFATSPIAVFAVFIFSQYDIFGVFFTLLGFYFFVKKDYYRFSWVFSIAISFKYFALFAYIPLVLMAEKRIFQIIKYIFIGVSITAVQVAIYFRSEIFMSEIFTLASGKASGAFGATAFYRQQIFYIAVLYVLGCVYLYFKKFTVEYERIEIAVFVPIFSYGLMFSSVVWHPQWIILVVPYFALSSMFIRNRKILPVLDLVGMLVFVWLCVNYWQGNVDIGMMNRGVLREFMPVSSLMLSEIYRPIMLNYFKPVFYIYLFSPIFVFIYERIFRKTLRASNEGDVVFILRFIVGVSFFLVPCLVLPFVPMNIAIKLNPDAIVKSMNHSVLATAAEVPVGEIIPGKPVVQTFTATANGMAGLSVYLATYSRTNNCQVSLSLEDSEGVLVDNNVIDASSVIDNSYFSFAFAPVVDSKMKVYKLVIDGVDCQPGNAITVWSSRADDYLEGGMTTGSVKNEGDIVMNVLYDPTVR